MDATSFPGKVKIIISQNALFLGETLKLKSREKNFESNILSGLFGWS